MKQKKLWPVLLTLVLTLSILPSAYAADSEAAAAANELYEMGLFNGTGTDANGNPEFELDRPPTRNEAVTMLVRLLGREEEAKSRTWSIPFTDVADWARPYVGYAYANGLTNGNSATSFGGEEPATPSQYITFVLRALGYQSGTDFQWDRAWELSDKLGFTKGEYTERGVQKYVVSGDPNHPILESRFFLRGDVAIISNNALLMKLKGTDTLLLAKVKGDVGAHTHNYIEKAVPGTGHYEHVYIGDDFQPVYETRWVWECRMCGATFYSASEMIVHAGIGDGIPLDFSNPCLGANNLFYQAKVQTGEVAVPMYADQWVEETIRVCEICGQQE